MDDGAASVPEYKACAYFKIHLWLTISLIISKVCITKIVTLDLYFEILSNDQTFVPINYIL